MIGGVEARPLERDGRGREHLAELASADRTDRERVVDHRLDDVERVAAIATAVLVGRHNASSLAEGSNAPWRLAACFVIRLSTHVDPTFGLAFQPMFAWPARATVIT